MLKVGELLLGAVHAFIKRPACVITGDSVLLFGIGTLNRSIGSTCAVVAPATSDLRCGRVSDSPIELIVDYNGYRVFIVPVSACIMRLRLLSLHAEVSCLSLSSNALLLQRIG